MKVCARCGPTLVWGQNSGPLGGVGVARGGVALASADLLRRTPGAKAGPERPGTVNAAHTDPGIDRGLVEPFQQQQAAGLGVQCEPGRTVTREWRLRRGCSRLTGGQVAMPEAATLARDLPATRPVPDHPFHAFIVGQGVPGMGSG